MARPATTSRKPAPAADVAAIERAFVRIRRSQTRRTLGRAASGALGREVDLTAVAVVDAIEEGPAEGAALVTVGDIALRLGIDPSRASRVAAAAVAAGYAERRAAPGDGRRVGLVLTVSGRRIAADVRRFRQKALGAVVRGWTAEERRVFARLLTRFVDGLASGPR